MLVAPGGDLEVASVNVRAMVERLSHRGPDSVGGGRAGRFVAGISRLSLVGGPDGHQPVTGVHGQVIMVCNGEVFGYRARRRDLEVRGHRFRGTSDVEVMLHVYEEEGVSGLERLEGQYALALYDGRIDTLYLIRDHAGICPLYYRESGGGLAFASSALVLAEHMHPKPSLALSGLYQTLTLPGLVSPQTMFEGIASVPPGCCMEFVGHASGSVRRYWDLEYPRAAADERAQRSEIDAAEWLTRALADAVEARLDADVAVGAYLSGGLDSSLVAALAVAVTGERLPATFSARYSDARFDESGFSRAVASGLSADHHEVTITAADIMRELPSVVLASEAPLRESYNVGSFMLSRAVRAAGLKTVLGGEGADELFGGYPGYIFDGASEYRGHDYAGNPEELLAREAVFGDSRLRYEHDLTSLDRWARGLLSKELLGDIDGWRAHASLVDRSSLEGRHPQEQRSYLDFRFRLADHLLGDHGDRMAMAHGVELRYPFLDRKVCLVAQSLRPEMKVRMAIDKLVVRRAAEQFLPESVARREKRSWASHGSAELLVGARPKQGAELLDWVLSDEKIKRDGIFDPLAVRRLVSLQREGPGYSPNDVPDYLMVVITTGMLTELTGMTCV